MTERSDGRGISRRRALGTIGVAAGYLSSGTAGANTGPSEDERDAGAVRWSETFERPNQYVECNAITAADGGYYLAGETGFQDGTSHGWVQRVDDTGSEEWEFIDDRPGDEAPLHAVSTAPEDGCVTVGDVTTHLTDESNITALGIGFDGEFDWATEFARSWHVSSSTLAATGDGYVIGAYARSYATQGTRMLLLSIDENGEQQWIRVFGEPDAVNVCRAVLPVDDGYLLAGSTDREDDSHVLLSRTDERGRLEWEETYELDGAYSLAHAIVPTGDGGYLLGGRTGSSAHIYRACVIKTDADGVEQWRWVNDIESACFDLAARPAGGCALAGRRLEEGWLGALNDDGELVASESYSGDGESAFRSLVAVDDGYVTAGRTAELGSSDTRAWLLSAGPLAEPGAEPIEPEYTVAEQEDDSLPGFSAGGALVGLSAAYALARRVGGRSGGSGSSTGREE